MAIINTKPDMNMGIWAEGGNIEIPSDTKIDEGWVVEKPLNEYMNFVQNRQDRMLQYINQRGIPEWDLRTEYPTNAHVARAGKIYKALSLNTDADPLSNPLIWVIAFASYEEFFTLAQEVDNIKNIDGYLNTYVSKQNPVMDGKSLGVSYSFKDNQDIELKIESGKASIVKDDNVVVSFQENLPTNDFSNNVATTSWVTSLINQTLNSILPVGAMIEYPNEVVPSENLMYAHGQAISRSQYPELFAVIGTRYGAGDGSTTFNLPDKRGRFTREWDNGKGIDSGRTLGSLQKGQIEKHKHIQSLGEAYDIAGIFGKSSTKGFQGSSGGLDDDNYLWYTNDGTHYQTANPNSENPDVIGNETRPINIALVTLIRVK